MFRWSTWLLLFLLPLGASAQVRISEVAWMGTEVSPNDEWIELHNESEQPVSLAEWKITDGNSLEIVLAGAVGAGEYIVLERTNDESAEGKAFLIYTGALANGGRTLVLENAAGNIIDKVVGGEGWEEVGGNNRTKETAQWTTNGWITAPKTPGNAPPHEEVKATHTSSALTPREDEGQLPGGVMLAYTAEPERRGGALPFVGLIFVILLAMLGVYHKKMRS